MKRVGLFTIVVVLLFCGCQKESKEEISYASYAGQSFAKLGDEYIYPLNGVLYSLNSDSLEFKPLCRLQDCDHIVKRLGQEIGDKNCQANIADRAYAGSYNEKLYTADIYLEKVLLSITEIDPESMEKEILIQFDPDNLCSNVFFQNGYCYYEHMTISGSEFDKAYIMRVKLQKDAKPEILWESDDRGYVAKLNICDDYLMWTALDRDVKNINLFLYDLNKDQLILDNKKGMGNVGYRAGQLIYVNAGQKAMDIYDIKKAQVVKSIPIDAYTEDMLLSCDNDYIYLSHDFFIEIYNHAGERVNQVDMSDIINVRDGSASDADQVNQLSARYLCSTDQYIFMGNRQLCHGIYMAKKSQVKEGGEIEVNVLYEENIGDILE